MLRLSLQKVLKVKAGQCKIIKECISVSKTGKILKVQEFGGEQDTIDFHFAITDRSKAKMMQSRLTIETRLKNPLMQEFLPFFFFPLRFWLIIPSRLSLLYSPFLLCFWLISYFSLRAWLRFRTYKHDNKRTHKESKGRQQMPQVMPVKKS